MTYDDIFNNKAFDCLEPERKHAFAKLYTALQGKTAQQALPIIMNFMQTMPRGRQLSAGEKNAMLAVVTADMNESEKRNVEMIMKMIM